MKFDAQIFSQEDYIVYELDGPIRSSSFINSLVVPRPIAFITTLSEEGIVNAAPFSYFNIACTNPAMVSVAIERRNGERKDTSRNIVATHEFVVNICSLELAQAVSISGNDFPPHVSEIELAGLSLIPSQKIRAPRIANTLAQLECRLYKIIELGKDSTDLILGEIVQVHVHKTILNDEKKIDPVKINPLARVAGPTFASLSNYFDIPL